MAGINKVILVGNLGADPEIRTFDQGIKKASFSLATSESYKDKEGNRVDQTEWHNISLWRGLAEVAEKYLHKGSKIYLEGKIRTRSYEKDGIKKYFTEIQGDNFVMLDTRGDSGNVPPDVAAQEQRPAQTPQTTKDTDVEQPTDDLPF